MLHPRLFALTKRQATSNANKGDEGNGEFGSNRLRKALQSYSGTIIIAILCLLLAFSFLGTRGIWDPDEGRYTNVALTMVDTGDWLSPKRSSEVGHWTKPPLTYWILAGRVQLFGFSPWAARLPVALSFLACVLLAGLTARRLIRGSGRPTAAIYATMLLPFTAGQLITTDYILSATQALVMYAYIEYRFSHSRPQQWWLLTWFALGLGFLTKGPPALTPLLVIYAMAVLSPGPKLKLVTHALALLIFAAIALPWYVAVTMLNPGLLQYFIGAEVIDRIASDRFRRNGQWYGWLAVFGPTLLLGTLPWTASIAGWLVRTGRSIYTSGLRDVRQIQPERLLLALWICLPLLVFCLSRSRLPLYVLPLFVPLAIAAASDRSERGKGLPRLRWMLLWSALLVGTRIAGANWETHKDASAWAAAIETRVPWPIDTVAFVDDMARYGLHLELGATVSKLSLRAQPMPAFNPASDGSLLNGLAEGLYHESLLISKEEAYGEISQVLAAEGYVLHRWGSAYEGRVMFSIVPAAMGGKSLLDLRSLHSQ